MTTILHIDSSITGDASVSRQLTAATVAKLQRAASDATVIRRDLVAGRTFRYTANGPEGLAGNKRVIVAVSRGGFYEDGNAMEHLKSYLAGLFGFIGVTPEFVHADGINYGPEQRDAGIANGLAEAERLAA